MDMKKIAIYISLALFGSISSCKNFLETTPQDFLSTSNYFQTEQHLMNSIASVYDILGQNPVYGANYHSKLGTEADEGYYNRANFTVGPQVYNITSNNTDLYNFWAALYRGIGRANFLLENVDNNKGIDEVFRNRIRGEALFLRSYYYFLLVQNFGNVPLMLKTTKDPNDDQVASSPAKEVYEQIISDMEAAEALVPPIHEVGYGGRVSKSAVRGILARVCLYMAGEPIKDIAKYEKARYWAEKVILDAEAGHRLNPNYYEVFVNYAADKYDYKESIWEVEFFGNASDKYVEGGYLGSWHGLGYGLNVGMEVVPIGYSQGIIRATRTLYDRYENDGGVADLRRDWSIGAYRFATGGVRSYFPTSPTALQKYERFSGKYRREYEEVKPKNANTTPINFPLLRYSDVLLMYVEADNELNASPSATAIDRLNQVRMRAWSDGIKTITVTNGGSGYTAAPSVNITGGGGSGAFARANVSGGKVTSVVLIPNPTGFGYAQEKGSYKSEPTITFTGVGTGATAVATIHHKNDAKIASTISQDDLRKLVRDERSRELCFEGLRKQDLIRWGVFYETMKATLSTIDGDLAGTTLSWVNLAYKNVEKRHVIYPIPALERQINKLLDQNIDWL